MCTPLLFDLIFRPTIQAQRDHFDYFRWGENLEMYATFFSFCFFIALFKSSDPSTKGESSIVLDGSRDLRRDTITRITSYQLGRDLWRFLYCFLAWAGTHFFVYSCG